MEELNVIAIIVATLAGILIGAVWHSPILFGSMFTDKDGSKQSGHKPVIYIIHIISLILIATFLSFATEESEDQSNLSNAHHGLIHGMYICLLLVIPLIVTNASFEGRDWKYQLAVCGNWVLSILVMSAIVSSFS